MLGSTSPIISTFVLALYLLQQQQQTASVVVMALRSAALVTGSTDGIGITTAKHLVARGYDVLIHGRDPYRIERASDVVRTFAKTILESGENMKKEAGIVWSLPPADISTIKGASELASHVQVLCKDNDLGLSILMNNAGVFSTDHVLTEDGIELTFAVNVVAPFIITSFLLPQLKAQPMSRIVIASSISQSHSIQNWDDLSFKTRSYSAHRAYSESKLLDAMLTIEMASRLLNTPMQSNHITCNCLDPGTVNTKMLRAGWGCCGIDVEKALDETWLCTCEEAESVSGRYFVYRSEHRASQSAYELKERQQLWSILSDLAPAAARMWE